MISVHVGPPASAGVHALVTSATERDGYDSLGDDARRSLDTGGDPESVTITAGDFEAPVAIVHVRRIDTDDGPHGELRLVTDATARDPRLLASLMRRGILPFAENGLDVVAWFPGAPSHTDDAAEAAGFEPQRVLYRMEGPLPDAAAPMPEGVTLRSYDPAADAAWIALNNRAFAGHPEQGGWTVQRLHQVTGQGWFDPQGLLLAFEGDDLVGFCWTKLHPDGAGEIYVIGVDPDRQRSGLGRALTVAGLAHLRSRGATRGLLYVDAANEAAVALYRSLGFAITRSDAAWIREARP